MAVSSNTSSKNTPFQTILTLLFLFLIFPIGLTLMWVLMKSWPTWVKILLTVVMPIAGIFFILPLLFAIIFITLNPSSLKNPNQLLAKAQNSTRKGDITSLLNAVDKYALDNSGRLPPGTPSEGQSLQISSSGTGESFCNALVPNYISRIPSDPTVGKYENCEDYDSWYKIYVSTSPSGNQSITITAPNAALGENISVTK